MRKRIPNKVVSDTWSKLHPRTKQPPVQAFVTSKRELNRVTTNSLKGKQGLEQNTKKEYGKHNAISSETHNVKGLIIHGKHKNTILIERGTKRNTTHILKHELNHVYEQRRSKS